MTVAADAAGYDIERLRLRLANPGDQAGSGERAGPQSARPRSAGPRSTPPTRKRRTR
jgi:hypothetical protein